MSAILQAAFEQWQEMRDEFELFRHAQYERAVAELRGELLSRRGQREHIDPYSLFMGPVTRVKAYASEELIEWWTRNRRMSVKEFEEQWIAQRTEDWT